MRRFWFLLLWASGLCACKSAPSGGAPDAGPPGAGAGAGADAGAGVGPLPVPSFECPRFGASVVSVAFGAGPSFGQDAESFPENVLGPPDGSGCCTGGLDVATLGDGGMIVLDFGGTVIVDGPGSDFVVFENAFEVGGDPENVFRELGSVAVSLDGESWTEFPCSAEEDAGCAGRSPVLASYEDGVDPLDPSVSGGDLFDLADVGVERARFVRVTDLPGDPDALDCCFDLDAIGVLSASCEEPDVDAGTNP